MKTPALKRGGKPGGTDRFPTSGGPITLTMKLIIVAANRKIAAAGTPAKPKKSRQ